ncbi:MAG TPA: MarR family winged helix-turn-helix transcriptional regulator [Steroidobacteraceae bacterium]|jgi:DNA-binding MarR family transcriptional regulator|nr:MarR family winged helix-turn-helix transcriptional regulator [Steroidobacteraceae bacterium]
MQPSKALSLCNCFAVRQAARQVTKLYEHHLGKAELTSAQFSILVALNEGGRLTMVELAKELVMDRTTLLRAMKPLQREGHLKSAASDAYPRQRLFALSSAGERKLKQALPLWAKAQEEFESGMNPGEAARLRGALLALAGNG